MIAVIHPHDFYGTFRVPASKSHTVRRLIMASLTDGISEIYDPLDSLDTRSCICVCRSLGAEISEQTIYTENEKYSPPRTKWTVRRHPISENSRCNAGNSGTTFYLALAAASLGSAEVVLDGDEMLRRRSAAPLLDALAALGIKVNSAPGGCAPVSIQGPWKGGRVNLPCPTSQYLSALLLAAPLAPAGTFTEIDVPLLNEKPYIEMTLSYLKEQNIALEFSNDFSYFHIPGGAVYKPINGPVPGDFSSAAFPACAALVSNDKQVPASQTISANQVLASQNESLILTGLDPHDTQGDKKFFDMLQKMDCRVKWEQKIDDAEPGILSGFRLPEWQLTLSIDGPLKSGTFDLNATPDLLPVMAVMAVFAQGETRLVNAAHARIKETDRISVMAAELGKLGAEITERPDGLVIQGMAGKKLKGAKLDSRGDHRIAMALACAALAADSRTEISGAESAAITYPGFMELLKADII